MRFVMNRKNKFIALLGVGAVAIWPMASEAVICPAGYYCTNIGGSYWCCKYPTTKGIKNSGIVGCEKTGTVCDPTQFAYAQQDVETLGLAPDQPLIVMTCANPRNNNNLQLPDGINIKTLTVAEAPPIYPFSDIVQTTFNKKWDPRGYDIPGYMTENPINKFNLDHLCTGSNAGINGTWSVIDSVSCIASTKITIKDINGATVIDQTSQLPVSSLCQPVRFRYLIALVIRMIRHWRWISLEGLVFGH